MNRGNIIIISGPSGVGKGTVIRELVKQDPTLYISISETTRAMHPGEEGNYHFISDEIFEERLRAGFYIEANRNLFGYKYGTPAPPLQKAINDGRTCILELDIIGARSVKAVFPYAKLIFLDAPSDVLNSRLLERRRDSKEEIKGRLERSEKERRQGHQLCDYVIENKNLVEAVSKISRIIETGRNINKVISLAEAEIGYHEKTSPVFLDHKSLNAGSQNFNKYARDLSETNLYGQCSKQALPWCAIFVHWLFLKTFGIDESKRRLYIGGEKGAGCKYCQKYYRDNDKFDHIVKPGSQIFFDRSHTGLVTKVDETSIEVIEGNFNNQVKKNTYLLSDSSIVGYGHPYYGVLL